MEKSKPVYSFCTALRNDPTESSNVRMDKCVERRAREEREPDANRKQLNLPVSVIQLQRFLEKTVDSRMEAQPPTVNSHGKLKDRTTCII